MYFGAENACVSSITPEGRAAYAAAFKFKDQSLHVSRPSKLCAQAQSGDDMPFHKQAYMEYTRWVFCKLFGRPRERHLACLTRMHGFRPLFFQGFVLNHGLIPLPDHLFGGDTGCAKCGHPVNGPYCQGCALLRESLEEDLVSYFQNFQNTSESSDDSTNVVNAPREPIVVKQDHGVNPPQIDKCCCECGEALDGIYCQRCIYKSCGKGAHTGYNCPPKKQEEKRIEEEQAASARYWKIPACCDDDEDYDSAITTNLSIEETDNSLSMGDEHLDTISATESDEVIKSSVEDLIPIPSESEVMTTLSTKRTLSMLRHHLMILSSSA
nr:hypothetical protein [Tanacetum cinerariifolium]